MTSFAMGFKICVLTEAIKKYKLIIKEEKKKINKKVLLAKSKLNRIEVLVFQNLIDSNINYDEYVLINNVLKEYEEMKEETKNEIVLFEV